VARLLAFPIDVSKSLDRSVFPLGASVGLFFDFVHRGRRGSLYQGRVDAALDLAEKRGLDVFEYNSLSLAAGDRYSPGFFGLVIASGDQEVRDRFSVFLVMGS